MVRCEFCEGLIPRASANEPTCTACNPCTGPCEGKGSYGGAGLAHEGYMHCHTCSGTGYMPFVEPEVVEEVPPVVTPQVEVNLWHRPVPEVETVSLSRSKNGPWANFVYFIRSTFV